MAPENLKKYTQRSDEDLVAIIKRYPFYQLPKIALLIKKGKEDQGLLNHVALTVTDRKKLVAYIESRADFL